MSREARAPMLDRSAIERLIPHRDPFLLLDRIVSEDRAAQTLVAELDVRADAFWAPGHFPGMPIMPGVLQVEALAQAMAVYVARTEGFGSKLGVFAKIEECRFTRMVVPGETLRLEITMLKLGSRMGSAKGVARVGADAACSATITFVIPPDGALPRSGGPTTQSEGVAE